MYVLEEGRLARREEQLLNSIKDSQTVCDTPFDNILRSRRRTISFFKTLAYLLDKYAKQKIHEMPLFPYIIPPTRLYPMTYFSSVTYLHKTLHSRSYLVQYGVYEKPYECGLLRKRLLFWRNQLSYVRKLCV